MQDNPKTTGQELQSCEPHKLVALPLRDDKEAKQRLATKIYQEFHAMRTYGKEPESLESIIPLFTEALADYPYETVLKAFKRHSEISQEFPTRFDIINLIKRNGKPPLSESHAVHISKKDPEDRTKDDWKYLEEWEEHLRADQWEAYEYEDPKVAEVNAENLRLRAKIKQLEDENERAWQEVKTLRLAKIPETQLPEKIQKTIQYMQQIGSSQEEIDSFCALQGILSQKAA